jgi:hypothetical protein
MSLSASSQGVVYAIVILYSLWWGGIDFVIPVKYALLTALFLILYQPIGDFGLELRKFLVKPPAHTDRPMPGVPTEDSNMKTLGISSLHVLGLIGIAAVLAPFVISFILTPYTNVNLGMLGNDVKIEASVGVILLGGLGGTQIVRTLKLEGKIIGLLKRVKRGASATQ